MAKDYALSDIKPTGDASLAYAPYRTYQMHSRCGRIILFRCRHVARPASSPAMACRTYSSRRAIPGDLITASIRPPLLSVCGSVMSGRAWYSGEPWVFPYVAEAS